MIHSGSITCLYGQSVVRDILSRRPASVAGWSRRHARGRSDASAGGTGGDPAVRAGGGRPAGAGIVPCGPSRLRRHWALDSLRASEYWYLDADGQIYLDYTGAGLPAQAQIMSKRFGYAIDKRYLPLLLLFGWSGRHTRTTLAEGWQRYQVAADGKYGEPIPLPAPFGFAVESSDWPRYRD
jgi:hypothetical protein